MKLFNFEMGNVLGIAGTINNWEPVFETKQNLVNKNLIYNWSEWIHYLMLDSLKFVE